MEGRRRHPRLLTVALAAALKLGDGAYIAHDVCKNDPVGAYFASTPSFLAWRPTGRCAARALATLELRAGLARSQAARKATPLFGPSVRAPFTGPQLDAVFRFLLAQGARLAPAAIAAYSIHSFRIFLACALLAEGCPRWLIKRILRWRGDESLDIYARVSDQEWSARGAAALGATVDAALVPRLPQIEFSDAQEAEFRNMAHALLAANLSAQRGGSA